MIIFSNKEIIKITLLTKLFEINLVDEYVVQSYKTEINFINYGSLIFEMFKGIQFSKISGAKECAIEYFLEPRIKQL